MDDLISRQAAIDALDKILPANPMKNDYTQGITVGAALAIEYIKQLPSAQPDLDEWCTDCKEYDQEKHCCPRFNRVIRETVEEVRKNAEQRWIPVEDEPPKFGKDVLISHKGAVSIDWLTQSEGSAYFFMSGAGIADIDAWQPLPKPYEGGEDENV